MYIHTTRFRFLPLGDQAACSLGAEASGRRRLGHTFGQRRGAAAEQVISCDNRSQHRHGFFFRYRFLGDDCVMGAIAVRGFWHASSCWVACGWWPLLFGLFRCGCGKEEKSMRGDDENNVEWSSGRFHVFSIGLTERLYTTRQRHYFPPSASEQASSDLS